MPYDPLTGKWTGGLLSGGGASGFGGLLGNALTGGNPLFNLSLGYLAQLGPSTTPTSPFQRFGRAAAYASEANQQAMQNQLIRDSVEEKKRQRVAEERLQGFIGGITPPEGFSEEAWKATVAAYPEMALKAAMPERMSFADKVAAATLEHTINKDRAEALLKEQQAASEGAATVTGQAAQIQDIGNIADASERLEGQDSWFEPGGAVDLLGGLPAASAAYGAINRTPAASETTRQGYQNIQDALTVQKNSAALVQRLQAQSPSTGRSNQALQNIQLAMGQNMPWPVKRRILISNLDNVLLDIKLQGTADKIPEYASTQNLLERLKEQDKKFTAGGSGIKEADQLTSQFNKEHPGGIDDVIANNPYAAAARGNVGSVGVQNGRLVNQIAPVTTDLPPQAPTPENPFNPNSNFVMGGPGPVGVVKDFLGLPPGYSATDVMPDLQNYAAPYIQQGSKAAAQAVPVAKAAVEAVAKGARKVGSAAIDALGRYVFRSDAEVQRALKNNWLQIGDKVMVNGREFTVQGDQ